MKSSPFPSEYYKNMNSEALVLKSPFACFEKTASLLRPKHKSCRPISSLYKACWEVRIAKGWQNGNWKKQLKACLSISGCPASCWWTVHGPCFVFNKWIKFKSHYFLPRSIASQYGRSLFWPLKGVNEPDFKILFFGIWLQKERF